jgi:hypothetical protein
MLGPLEIPPDTDDRSESTLTPRRAPAVESVTAGLRSPIPPDDLAWLSLSATPTGSVETPADVDREICRLALVRINPSDDEPPLAGDRLM